MQFATIAFGDGFQIVETSTSVAINDRMSPIIETIKKLSCPRIATNLIIFIQYCRKLLFCRKSRLIRNSFIKV